MLPKHFRFKFRETVLHHQRYGFFAQASSTKIRFGNHYFYFCKSSADHKCFDGKSLARPQPGDKPEARAPMRSVITRIGHITKSAWSPAPSQRHFRTVTINVNPASFNCDNECALSKRSLYGSVCRKRNKLFRWDLVFIDYNRNILRPDRTAKF
uniref:Uncharacterized protein n=1 Tax=Romanomermis culicivorax TaxID=13658 RepID=A0A915K463_ROMCU